jgi:hypothetical protein
MIVSTRSRALLLGSALAPVAIVFFSFSYLKAKSAAEARGGMLLTYHPGLLFDAMVVVGIVCFAAALISLFADSRSVP